MRPSFMIMIPHVNRIDLTRKAVDSVPHAFRENLIVINNSKEEIFTGDIGIAVKSPIVPLSLSQSINAAFANCEYSNIDVCFFMHNDAIAPKNTFETLLTHAETFRATGWKWGCIFTNYDAVVMFNMEMVRVVGGWDTVLPCYFADNDYYRRMRLAGWPSFESGIKVHHEYSSTIKSDENLCRINEATFGLYSQYYARKWGGTPGEETYERPFNI